MSRIDRLQSYNALDDDVIACVDEVAERQNRLSFSELADQYGISEGPKRVIPPGEKQPIEYLQINPTVDHDPTRMRVYHAPMSIPADENMAMRAMRLFATDPTEPLVVIGNPAAIGNRTNKLTLPDMFRVWRHSDLAPVVRPLLRHLQAEGVSTTSELGYSYGADKALTAARVAAEYDIKVAATVSVESAAVKSRGLPILLMDFKKTEGPLEDYVAAAESGALIEARQIADSGLWRYVGGLGRGSNLAIAHTLSIPLYGERLVRALRLQPDMMATIGWGTETEIGSPEAMRGIVKDLGGLAARVSAMELHGMHHAGGDDIDLHAAIMLQGLKNAR